MMCLQSPTPDIQHANGIVPAMSSLELIQLSSLKAMSVSEKALGFAAIKLLGLHPLDWRPILLFLLHVNTTIGAALPLRLRGEHTPFAHRRVCWRWESIGGDIISFSFDLGVLRSTRLLCLACSCCSWLWNAFG